MLDDIIDVNKYPDKIYENYQKSMRTIGLGYTGLADMLAMLGMKYNSEQAYKFTDNLMSFCAKAAYEASIELAKEKGCFPMCDPLAHANSPFIKKNLDSYLVNQIVKNGIRNAKIQAVAPTGTMSLTFGNNCSSGIEPIFSLSYTRRVKIGGQEEENEQTVEVMDYAYWLYNDLVKNGYKPDFSPEDIFVTAMEMTVKEHVLMLSIIQSHVDMSVSKTINVPEDYSFEDTKTIYSDCWKLGVKGCTIFRPNALRPGILSTSAVKKDNDAPVEFKEEHVALGRGDIINCSDDLVGKKRKLTTGCGSLHVLAFFDPITADLQECYLAKGSTGGCTNFMTGLSRMISLLARAGVSIYEIKDQLDSTGTCPSYATRRATHKDTSKGSCCPMAVGNALIEMYEEFLEEISWDEPEENTREIVTEEPTEVKENITNVANACPECGEPLDFEGGCATCKSCGWNKCS